MNNKKGIQPLPNLRKFKVVKLTKKMPCGIPDIIAYDVKELKSFLGYKYWVTTDADCYFETLEKAVECCERCNKMYFEKHSKYREEDID